MAIDSPHGSSEAGVAPALVLATRNAHKVRELRAILAPLLPELNPQAIVGADAFDVTEPVEDEVTFAGNALIKARALATATGLPAVADDSGICVDAMGGAPGVFSARWCGRHGADVENLELLLAQMADVPERHRRAHFHCAAALVSPHGDEFVAEGEMPGLVLFEREGESGFGYDPIFRADGQEVSNGMLPAHVKDSISHRFKAMRSLAPHIATVLGLRAPAAEQAGGTAG